MIGPKRHKRNQYAKADNCELPPQFFAKTYRTSLVERKIGRTVFNHCQIVGEVAKELISRSGIMLSDLLFPAGSELVAASHDVGKVCPTFQKKILQNSDSYLQDDYPMLERINPVLERSWGGHAGVSQLTLEAAAVGEYIPEIGGQHHGYSPQVGIYSADAEIFGGSQWQQERMLLLSKLQEYFQVDWPQVGSLEQARLLAGLTSVADWIGSGGIFDDPTRQWEACIIPAVERAGLIPPVYVKHLAFSEVFGSDYIPYPVQEEFVQQVTGPGVYILEAPMGMGKTEAALYAAYQLLCSHQACGIYFALPTQLTSNKIYQRFNSFLQTILAKNCSNRKALLLHGKAWLQETELGGEGAPGNSWFNSSKRGLLAPFAVGTLDQALMAAMNVRHGFVRAFGLAGKVVILDEIHTYDAYTGTIIDALVDLLKRLHCTVIILSATLSQDRRRQLLGVDVQSRAFPLISAKGSTGNFLEQPVHTPAPFCRRISLALPNDSHAAQEEALKRVEQGQQVLWIENTVAEAQERYLEMAARCAELGVACGLLHSRFTVADRLRAEGHWVNLFGKSGWDKRGQQGRLLIGTQVLEQSLDIDSDFLVTRFCPTDMLFQRLGRLWRHEKTPRNASACQEAWILAPQLEDAIEQPMKSFGSTSWVYSPYVLCRSLMVWQDKQQVEIPSDIRLFIEATYISREEQGKLSQWKQELEQGSRYRIGRQTLQQLARITLAGGGKTLPESKAQTRYSDEESCDVLLLRMMTMDPENRLTRFVLLTGEKMQLPWDKGKLSRREWRRTSARLMSQMVSVRYHHAPLPLPLDTLRKLRLQHCFYLGNAEMDEALLRLALVVDTGHLQGYQGAPLNEKFLLQYREDLGYTAHKIKD